MAKHPVFTPTLKSGAYSTVVVHRIRIAETRVRLSLSPQLVWGQVGEAAVRFCPGPQINKNMIKEKLQKSIVYPEVKLKDVLRAFWQGIKFKKWWLFLLLFLAVLGNIIAVIIPLFYKQFFDILTITGDKSVIAKDLLKIIIYVLILNGFYWIFFRIATIANNTYQTAVIAKLKQQAYDYLMQHSYSFFSNNFTGSLTQRVSRFARAFERLSDRLTWDLLPLIVRAISIIIVILFINKWIALVLFVWATIFLMFNILFSRWKLKYDIKVAEIDSKVTGYLADTITNQNTIQLFDSFKDESQGYKKITNEQAKSTIFTWNLDAIVEAGQSFLSFTIEFILFFFAIKYWQEGLITVGIFVLFQAYLINLIYQLWGFTRMVRDLYQGYADAKEMVEIMLLPHEIKDKPTASQLLVNKGEIEFKNLTFSFNQTRKVLEDINLIIKPGEKVALIGPSGAGKTTFVKLLLRLYTPTDGKIIIDGTDISDVTQGSLRKNIAMVPQDTILFHRTLAENIGYGDPSATKEDIEKAAKLAHCDDFIKELPYGFETYVGERGIKLSGGERQRVAIARAILKNAPILVLDEATSSLDSRSEGLIQDALNTLMASRTTIVIAHRLSTVKQMDRIIVIDNGKILEQGSHEELLNKEDSLYKKLWTFQAGGFLTDEDDEEDEEIEEEVEDDEEKNRGDAKLANF